MRVVEYGHIKPKEIFCSKCGATLEFTPVDIKNFKQGTPKETPYINCIVCGKAIYISRC